jgi:hypothetical protein
MKATACLKLVALLVLGSFALAGPAAAHNLIICKVGQRGVTGSFNFTVKVLPDGAPTNVSVPVGQCVDLGPYPIGPTVQITETVPSGTQVASIDVSPDYERRTCDPTATNKACVHISEGHNTVVTFTNGLIAAAHNLVICKVGRGGITGNFDFAVRVPPSTYSRIVTVVAGHCLDLGDIAIGTTVEITETVPTGVQVSNIDVAPSGDRRTCGTPASNRVCVQIGEHTTTVTFTNEPTPSICVLTKGYYRNHASAVASIIAGLGGTLNVGGGARTTATVQAILNATPGKPGNVTFTSNLLLNTTQQLITALLNLHGNVALAPAAVQTAIASAQAGIHITVGSSIAITTPLSQTQISNLTDTLSSFNEGNYRGFPHCSD